jgi:hypothetical protein
VEEARPNAFAISGWLILLFPSFPLLSFWQNAPNSDDTLLITVHILHDLFFSFAILRNNFTKQKIISSVQNKLQGGNNKFQAPLYHHHHRSIQVFSVNSAKNLYGAVMMTAGKGECSPFPPSFSAEW